MFYISIAINILFFCIILIILYNKSKKESSSDITNRLKQLDSIEKDVKELNSIFTIPYLRGEAGETLLKELLNNYLPKESFKLQYSFKSGQRVDAIIKTGKYIVPIDSKFPIQSVSEILSTDSNLSNSVLKTFIKYGEDISKKYIQPTEGTLNFAVMYIPSEKIYYKAFVAENNQLTNSLLNLGVLPCSPSTLFSFIQTVVYGLKGFTFNQRQSEIMEKIEALKINYTRLNKQFQISNSHLKNLKLSMGLCDKLIEDGAEIIPE